LSAVPEGVRRETFVAEVDDVPVGTVRADHREDACELGWTVAPEHRGKGYARRMIALAIETLEASDLVAEIKPNNPASIRIARSLGFAYAGERNGLTVWTLRPQAVRDADPAFFSRAAAQSLDV
jgi:RimJ/RimL family protein N-acetyltransferase